MVPSSWGIQGRKTILAGPTGGGMMCAFRNRCAVSISYHTASAYLCHKQSVSQRGQTTRRVDTDEKKTGKDCTSSRPRAESPPPPTWRRAQGTHVTECWVKCQVGRSDSMRVSSALLPGQRPKTKFLGVAQTPNPNLGRPPPEQVPKQAHIFGFWTPKFLTLLLEYFFVFC